ncbi:MAG: HlyD family secretion protein [bacterium]|nr:HlyD family secretion protein [bacterium]
MYWAIGVVSIAALLGAGSWWRYSQNYETTDNAYVHATVVPVSSRISGVITEVLTDDNLAVNAGDLIVRLDRSTYQVAVEKAEARVAVARGRYESGKISVTYSTGRSDALVDEVTARRGRLRQTLRSAQALLRQRRNEADAAAANFKKATDDLARKHRLYNEKVISEEELQQFMSTFKVAEANYKAAESAHMVETENISAVVQELKEVEASISLAKNEGRSTDMRKMDSTSLLAELKQAEAELKEARLNLSFTEIRAPISGYVSKRSIEAGEFVDPGRPLLIIVPLHKVYIRANFKEVQLEDIRVGQPVTIYADAYPKRAFQGHVGSIYTGTGDAFSLLPPENATGNWVKITRRVPVKIVLDVTPPTQYPLRIGMSAYVSVDVRNRSGLRLLAYPSRVEKDQRSTR